MDLSTKNIIRVLSIVTIFIFIIFLVVKVSWLFGWILAAFLIATILSPVAGFFQKIMPWNNRGLAVITTYLTALFALALFFFILIPPIASEVKIIMAQLSDWASSTDGANTINRLLGIIESQKSQVSTQSIYSALKEFSGTLASGFGGIFSSISGIIFAIISVSTLSFFMLLDELALVNGISYFVPQNKRPLVKKLHDDLFTLISKYFAGVIFVALIASIFALIPLLILGIPYPFVLAAIVGATSLIPMIGATIGGLVVVLSGLLSGGYLAAAIMTIYFVIYQQVENNLVIPLVQKKTVKMPPLAIIISLLLGGALAGGFGTLLAIPAAAFAKVTFDTLKKDTTEK